MTRIAGLPAIALAELLHYERAELDAWHRFFTDHPLALDLAFAPGGGGDSRMASVRGVVHHIAAVETRCCDRLAGAPVTAYEAIPAHATDPLFAAARTANTRLARWVAGASEADLARQLEFQTITAGVLRASARKIVAHTLVHGIRTWAQLATVARTHGIATSGRHDLLFSDALD